MVSFCVYDNINMGINNMVTLLRRGGALHGVTQLLDILILDLQANLKLLKMV